METLLRGDIGAAMVTAMYTPPHLWPADLECTGLVGTSKGQYSQTVSFLCGGPRDHRSICVRAHKFFNDSNGQLTESLPGKQVLHSIHACVTVTNDLILSSSLVIHLFSVPSLCY